MRLIDCSHCGNNIAEMIYDVFQEYGLSHKVFSITLDNVSANTRAMDHLTLFLSGYIGSLLLYQRCACHIINLVVYATFEQLEPYLGDFRTTIYFELIQPKNCCIQKFLCCYGSKTSQV
jgi:hypothetical protein